MGLLPKPGRSHHLGLQQLGLWREWVSAEGSPRLLGTDLQGLERDSERGH